jgi:thiamine kinase-like enzyme
VTEKAIAHAEQVTSGWLTHVLREGGTLPRGRVTGVTPDREQTTFASAVWRLAVRYSPDASPRAPQRLFLKTSNPALAPGEFDPEHLRREVVFYRTIAPAMDEPFTIPCYDAAYEPETGASHILLQDVSETHAACPSPLCQRNCERAADALAGLHAFWWDHPRLGVDVGSWPTAEERRQEWRDAVESTSAFMAVLGDRLCPSWRATYEKVLPALPALFRRHATGRNLTLAHGDAHLGNFLFPRAGGEGRTYLVDWQFWHPTIGGTDLAFMIATEWEPETRRQVERALLERYHGGLLARGVQDFSWEECWNDYRLSVILVSLFIPVWRWAVFKWAPELSTVDTVMTAFEDLRCGELLGG